MNLEFSDFAVIIFYFGGILLVGFRLSKKYSGGGEDSWEDYLLAGRKLTLPLFVGTLVATWYGNILGAGEFFYQSGIVAWVCFGLPYYFAAIIYAILIAKKIRISGSETIPEQIGKSYGKSASIASSAIVLIITIPAAYILMLGYLISMVAGIPLWISIIAGAILSLAYIYTGGFRADVFTNVAQFVMMFLGFGILLYFAVTEIGGFAEIRGSLPDEHLEFFGGLSWQVIASWWIISLQTFVDPSFFQRCAAAKSHITASRGIIVSVIFWMIFDFLELSAGLYAKALITTEDAITAYPALADEILPPIFKGVFFVALLATVMSTLDSYSFISAATIGNDILAKFRKKIPTAADKKKLTQIGLLVTGISAVFLAIAIPSAIELIYMTSSIAIPGLLMPLLVTYTEKFYLVPRNALLIMIISSAISLVWTILRNPAFSGTEFFTGIEPMIPGIIASLVLTLIFIRKK